MDVEQKLSQIDLDELITDTDLVAWDEGDMPLHTYIVKFYLEKEDNLLFLWKF